MTAHATVGINNNLSAGKTSISHRSTNNKATSWIDVNVCVVPSNVDLTHNRSNNVVNHVLLDNGHVLNLWGMLRGDNNSCDLNGFLVLIANGNLSLTIWTQILNLARLTHL